MRRLPLTDRQRQVLQAIRNHLAHAGAPPTIRELRGQLGLKSLRGVTVHLDALVRKGYIERSRAARGIRIRPRAGAEAPVTRLPAWIPVLGRIAAGAPLLAEQNIEDRLAVDPRLAPGPGCFSVRVHGDSMVEAGIADGDYVIIRPQSEAANGEIVAVLIEGEATVKRFYRERGGRIRLQPENRRLRALFVHPRESSVRVLGKVVGLFRRF